jgi:hypothetical protein
MDRYGVAVRGTVKPLMRSKLSDALFNSVQSGQNLLRRSSALR